jgi:DNA polymerase zeta
MILDPMNKTPYNWRLPYVIVCGPKTAKLIELAVTPLEVMKRGSRLKINAVYYLNKYILPSLDRVLALAGADIYSWYAELKRRSPFIRHIDYNKYDTLEKNKVSSKGFKKPSSNLRQQTMDSYTLQSYCDCCGSESMNISRTQGICRACQLNLPQTMLTLQTRLSNIEYEDLNRIKFCHDCSGRFQHRQLFAKGQLIGEDCCQSLNCEYFYDRYKLVLKIEDFENSLSRINDFSW